MKCFLYCLFVASPLAGLAQTLTVEKIMQDAKWIGSSPSGIFWSDDSKYICFDWNPDQQFSDSAYRVAVNSKTPEKTPYRNSQQLAAISNGSYNRHYTQLVYTYRGDLYWLETQTRKTLRITQTQEQESNPHFFRNDEWVVFTRNQNLFAWHISSGITQQLTHFIKGGETPAPAAQPVFSRGSTARSATDNNGAGFSNKQEQWLQQQQLQLMNVLNTRRQKKEARDAFLTRNRDTDTLKTIFIGDKTVSNLQVSPDGRYIFYRLYQAPAGARNTVVPDYVTESGFTTDLPGRTKVGAPAGKYEWYIFNTVQDTVFQVLADSIPGITDVPDYVKDYPQRKTTLSTRGVIFNGPYWNEAGTAALADISSQDNKDRWIMQLDAATGKLTLVDRQRDEAWIGGPGIGYSLGGSTIGWIDEHTCYFQSEASGYAHLYSYDLQRHSKKQLTQGSYEVQQVVLSRSKKQFYLLTNETHPGKQNWYRIQTDGSGKEKITSAEGGYEVFLSPDEKYIAYRYAYINQPWELFVQENAPGKTPRQLTFKAASDSFRAYPWRDTKIFTLPARDGKRIYARLYQPTPGKKNGAAVIFVHGAGYLQNVHYWWSQYYHEYFFNNLLADKGYTVLDIDYRGSAGYGRDWRTGIYRHMGGKDLDDEIDAARYLVTTQGIDTARIGIYGGSYGGFMTLMALFTQPDVFKAGAALRPVTDWAHYNQGYTANILNEPVADSIAYQRSSPIYFAGGLKNHLLICHGMVDVNVHFQDAVRLNQRLIELGKDNWNLAVYPMEDHGFVEPSSWTDEYKRILHLFDTWLLP